MAATYELQKFGLRFKRGDAQILRNLATRVRLGDLEGNVATFEQAAISAELNEPLEVQCTPDEAKLIALGYVLHGTSLPTIDELNG